MSVRHFRHKLIVQIGRYLFLSKPPTETTNSTHCKTRRHIDVQDISCMLHIGFEHISQLSSTILSKIIYVNKTLALPVYNIFIHTVIRRYTFAVCAHVKIIMHTNRSHMNNLFFFKKKIAFANEKSMRRMLSSCFLLRKKLKKKRNFQICSLMTFVSVRIEVLYTLK